MHFQVSSMLADTRTHTVPRAFEPHQLIKGAGMASQDLVLCIHTGNHPYSQDRPANWQYSSQEAHTHVGLGSCASYTWAVRSTSCISRSCFARIHLGYLHSRQQSLCCPSQREMAYQHKGARINLETQHMLCVSFQLPSCSQPCA